MTVSSGEVNQPIESVIKYLSSTSLQLRYQPPEFAQGGETYFYTIELDDQGPEDEIVELVEDIDRCS